ncbi:MAG: CehA/McbA family metallohydrolase [Acidobacteria bacterium]|nr:CehA/McbA family metallohydrolase [Acidobacteriota bacterium]
MQLPRRALIPLFLAALGWAQFRESGDAALAAQLQLVTAPQMPVRIYLFKDGRPFRLSPVDAMLPLRADLFYRERVWRRAADPSVLEVTCNDQSHFFLLKGKAEFALPAGNYVVEAYRGLFYKPFRTEFRLEAGKSQRIELKMEDWTGGESSQWLSADDHIHLVRAPEDNAIFLSWMDAEDLSVGNFLQLQRQMDAAAQYGFGPKAEAKSAGRSIRSGHESRSEFFGHVNLLGGREMIRPLSLGRVYANGPETFPYPYVLFGMGKKAGALTGFAHFDGSQKHSSLLMDLALGALDFVEVLQFGRLRTEEWYQLLNAGFRVTGVAGSDFPVSLSNVTRQPKWTRWTPLLGPERMLVRRRAGSSAYEAWADAVRQGDGLVTNGPLVTLEVSGERVTAHGRFHRPLSKLEIVANGKVIGAAANGASLSVQAALPAVRPLWVAARASAEADPVGTVELQAHTNPRYVGWNGSAPEPGARQALAEKWEKEIDYYRTAELVFPSPEEKARFFAHCERALQIIRTGRE